MKTTRRPLWMRCATGRASIIEDFSGHEHPHFRPALAAFQACLREVAITAMLDENTILKLKANLFKAAHPAIDSYGWHNFPWHSNPGGGIDTYKIHSSQALAIDLFGTIKTSKDRDRVMDQLALKVGLPTGGPWSIEWEWIDEENNHLGELHRTQVDVSARSPHALIFFECKFTENDGGICSQVHPIKVCGPNKGIVQCSGNYVLQQNGANGRAERCALTGKDILYWDVIPHVFGYSKDEDYSPCPFVGPEYQWMRNLTACWQYAQMNNLKPALLLIYAEGEGLAMAKKARPAQWDALVNRMRLNRTSITLERYSFQEILTLARDTAVTEKETFRELFRWVQHKITIVCGYQDAKKRMRKSRV